MKYFIKIVSGGEKKRRRALALTLYYYKKAKEMRNMEKNDDQNW